MRAAVVAVGEGAETLLAGGVEEVEAVGLAVDGELFELGKYKLGHALTAK
jgi:predicted NUDIX family NTP pyrophosphohydrolase